MMREFNLRTCVEDKIIADFDQFDFADKPMERYCAYHRTKHIQMATQLTLNFIELGDYVSTDDINDFIHGLNHIFFNGVAAGQAFEWKKNN